MGQVYSMLATGAVLTGWAIGWLAREAFSKAAYYFLLVPIAIYVGRDSSSASIQTQPKMFVKVHTDAYSEQMVHQQMVMQWWNQTSGTAYACWEHNPNACGHLQNYFIHCWDWSETGVPDDIPKAAPFQEYTPSGIIVTSTPDGMHTISGEWVAAIAGDCRYWDRDWKQPSLAEEHKDMESLEKEIQESGWKKPKWAVPKIAPPEPAHPNVEARHMASQMLQRHFSAPPPVDVGEALDRYLLQGAAVVHHHMRSNASSGTHHTLKSAMNAVLDAHDGRHDDSSVAKREGASATITMDVVIDSLVDAVIRTSHDDNKKKMRAFAIHAMSDLVVDRIQSGKAGTLEANVLDRMWDRSFEVEEQAWKGSDTVTKCRVMYN